MNHKLIQALQQFDIRRTEKLGTSESAVFAPGEKGAEMIADTFLPIAKYALYGGHFHVDYKKGDGWAVERQAQGWTYGPQRDDLKKETPCMVPYSQLPDSEKKFDRDMAMNTLKLVKKLGYDLIKR